MTPSNPEASFIASARAAGLFYLVIIVCGIGGSALVREPLMVAGDAAQTAANLRAHSGMFRLSILADAVMALSDVALAVSLFFLLRPVDTVLSALALSFRLVQASILGLNLLNLQRALELASDAALDGTTRDAWVMSLLRAHGAGYDFGLFFFGINCLAVGALLWRMRPAARALGVLVAGSGLVYLAGSTAQVVAPGLRAALEALYLLPLVAESALCVWLLSRGRGWRPAPVGGRVSAVARA